LTFPRSIQPEILDSLDAADPRAIHSRRDLQRVNTLMGHTRILARALRGHIEGSRVVELGAGDGTCLLRVAERLGAPKTAVRAVLVDRRPSVSAKTRAGFAAAGWQIDVDQADVFEWLERRSERCDVTIANLFLHHFSAAALSELLAHVCEKTRTFIACEPRRSRTGIVGAHLLRFVGCSDVTLHDARVSVRAGFRKRELSALWPRHARWHLSEGRAGLFTHTFVAHHAP
jgi:SAM-dependent methyltransferase